MISILEDENISMQSLIEQRLSLEINRRLARRRK